MPTTPTTLVDRMINDGLIGLATGAGRVSNNPIRFQSASEKENKFAVTLVLLHTIEHAILKRIGIKILQAKYRPGFIEAIEGVASDETRHVIYFDVSSSFGSILKESVECISNKNEHLK